MEVRIFSPSSKVKPDHGYIPREYRKVAQGLEEQFARFMIDEMEKTTGRNDKTTAGNYYQSLLNSHRAKIMSETNGGLGLQDMILDQIYPAKFRNKEAYELYLKNAKEQRK